MYESFEYNCQDLPKKKKKKIQTPKRCLCGFRYEINFKTAAKICVDTSCYVMVLNIKQDILLMPRKAYYTSTFKHRALLMPSKIYSINSSRS
jgi:hypothetical protein